MNIKQKMLQAMKAVPIDCTHGQLLDAALAVMADPENWTAEMRAASGSAYPDEGDIDFERVEFAAVITHIKGLPT